MHKIFGIKENVKYVTRKGAYLILIHDNQVGIVQTPKGFFLVGGGLKSGENHNECVKENVLKKLDVTFL